MTDNWLELTVRFLAPDHGIREIKDRMSRDILAALDKAEIGIASGTYADRRNAADQARGGAAGLEFLRAELAGDIFEA